MSSSWFAQRRALLADSEQVRVQRRKGEKWLLRQDFPLHRAEAAVQAHRNVVVNDPRSLLKKGDRRCVSLVTAGTEYVVVKEFFRPGPWGPFRPDRRSWLANWRLELLGLPAVRYLAWRRRGVEASHLVMEHVAGDTFELALRSAGEAAERLDLLFGALRELVETLYAHRILHEDLKTQNVIVAGWDGSSPRLRLVDNDAVLFGQRIGPSQQHRNARHIEGTLPPGQAVRQSFDRHFGAWLR